MSSNTTAAHTNGSADYDYMPWNEYPEYKAGVLIWKIVPPILIVLGTLGNIMSVLVLQRRAIRTSTTAFYLTVLAFSDLLVLYSGLLRHWIRSLFEIDVRHISEFGCKLNLFLVYFSLDMSAWTLMAVTLERIISVWFPHSAKSKCTKKLAAILLSTIAIFLVALNSHMFYGMGIRTSSDGHLDKCAPIDDEYQDFFNYAWTWIDLCAFCLIPFTFIVIGNTLILVKVIKSQQKTRARVNPIVTRNGNVATSNHGSGGGKKSSMTAILFTLNIVFLVTTSPVSVYNIGYMHWQKDATEEKYALLDLWWAIVTMLQYTNNSLNFLLYCLSGTKFRQEFLNMIHGCGSKVAKLQQSMYERTQFQATNSTMKVSQTDNTKLHVSPSISAMSADRTPIKHSNGVIEVKPAIGGNGVKLANNVTDVIKVVPSENRACQGRITHSTADMRRGDTPLSISLHPNDALDA